MRCGGTACRVFSPKVLLTDGGGLAPGVRGPNPSASVNDLSIVATVGWRVGLDAVPAYVTCLMPGPTVSRYLGRSVRCVCRIRSAPPGPLAARVYCSQGGSPPAMQGGHDHQPRGWRPQTLAACSTVSAPGCLGSCG